MNSWHRHCMRLMELYEPDPSDRLTYHNGTMLSGNIPVCILWYSNFLEIAAHFERDCTPFL